MSNFTFKEFLNSDTAKKLNIDNTPISFELVENSFYTVWQLQKIRDYLEKPIYITSGYRCLELNEAVNGSKNSQHCNFEAVDFICPAFGTPEQVCIAIKKSGILFDQLILEPTWIHISFRKSKNRKQYLETK